MCDGVQVVGEYEQHLRRLHRRPNTIRAYTGRARLFVRARPDWRTMDTLALERWLDSRDLGANGRAWWVTLLRGFYRWAADAGVLGDDRAARGLVRPRVPDAIPRPAAAEDVVMAFDLAVGPYRRIVALMMFAGLRCCEVAGLRWADVDEAAGALYVVGKGGHTRWVPLHRDLVDELGPAGRSTEPVIGVTWDARQVSWRTRRYLRSVGITATSHQLRHSFATRGYAVTRDIMAVSKLLGHRDVKTTQVYVRVDDERLRATVDAITYR